MQEEELRRHEHPTVAARTARRGFGNTTLASEDARAAWMWPWLESRWQDASYALRTLRRQPGFAAVAILTLALGIGATTVMFSLFDDVLVRPLPIPRPDGLVNLSAPGPKDGDSSSTEAGGTDDLFSYPMFRDLEREQQVFTAIAGHRLFDANLTHRSHTEHAKGLLVSGGYFPGLELTPIIGRLLGPDDDRFGGEAQVVVLAHSYWQARFGSDPGVLNQPMTVNGRLVSIVGVAPEGFSGTTLGRNPSVFVPITMRRLLEPASPRFVDRRAYWLYLFARLKPGVTIDQAGAALNVAYHGLINDVEAPLNKNLYPEEFARFKAKTVVLTPGRRGQSETPDRIKPALSLLFGATTCVLLIGCANIANLLLARAASRTSEITIRLSIGASRGRLIAQLLTESLVLALCGGLAGLLLAEWSMAAMPSLLTPGGLVPLRLDRTALVFTAVLALSTGLLFGLFPALQGTRAGLSASLNGRPIGARSAARFRTTLATAQIALSLALLVTAGLFVRSLANISRIDLGFSADRMLTFGVSPGLDGYAPERSQRIIARIEDQIGMLPGVLSVTDSMVRLLASNNTGNTVSVEGFKSGSTIDSDSLMNDVGPGYFSALGIPILAGREFTDADTVDSAKVAIVNEAFARKFNLGSNPVGKRMGDPGGALVVEIVGLAKDSKYSEVKDDMPALYFRPSRQDRLMDATNIYVRTGIEPEAVISVIPRIVATLDPNLPVEDLRTLPEQVRENVSVDRLTGLLSAGFAILATLLAAIGLYGVLAYTVSQRRRELGLRMALGATPRRVLAMVFGHVSRMALLGIVIGLIAAAWLGHALQSLLYGLQGSDPAVLIGSVVVMTAVGLTAGLMPAWRASRIDPASVLRCE